MAEGHTTASLRRVVSKCALSIITPRDQGRDKGKSGPARTILPQIFDLDKLTPAVLNEMVKAAYVHAPDKTKGDKEQQIDISYDLVGILPASLQNELQNRETA